MESTAPCRHTFLTAGFCVAHIPTCADGNAMVIDMYVSTEPPRSLLLMFTSDLHLPHTSAGSPWHGTKVNRFFDCHEISRKTIEPC